MEGCVEQKITFLDMEISNRDGRMSTSWYTKPTDTGTSLSFKAIAPMKYNRNLRSGHSHWILNSCSDWKSIHDGIEKAKEICSNIQYPRAFCESILKDTLQRLLTHEKPEKLDAKMDHLSLIFIQYRGRNSNLFKRRLATITFIRVVFTTRKLKSLLPSLKSDFPPELRSCVVYQIQCPGCNSSYVEHYVRHLATRHKEHQRVSAPVSQHITECAPDTPFPAVKVLDKCQNPS